MNQQVKRVVCIGGGHCNCQVLKLLKKLILEAEKNPELPKMKVTLINEAPLSYYSGMLPGSVSKLYTDDDIKIHLEPLAIWCAADYIEHRVAYIKADENRVYLENGETVDYDVLAVNVGSKTRDTLDVKGVWENGLTTRPINDLLPKIVNKENQLKADGIIPSVIVCGGGAAGTELSFAFKQRWSEFFGQEIQVKLICAKSEPVDEECRQTKDQIQRLLREKNIQIITNTTVKEILKDGVILANGDKVEGNVAVWATGAEPQGVTAKSDLAIMKGFFRVNKFLQSTSHPNVFAGGDCITMEDYADKSYPSKAGVYAVREGPFIAQNVIHFIKGENLDEYVPQTSFLKLMMTGDGSAIGSKFGICFVGKWVWAMKDYIDLSFMKLFDPHNLFKDYKTQGTKEPIDNFLLFDDSDEKEKEKQMIEALKQKVAVMGAEEAAKILGCDPQESEFHERLHILTRMHWEQDFRDEVVKNYNPPYLV